jgi:hypothetical protein
MFNEEDRGAILEYLSRTTSLHLRYEAAFIRIISVIAELRFRILEWDWHELAV